MRRVASLVACLCASAWSAIGCSSSSSAAGAPARDALATDALALAVDGATVAWLDASGALVLFDSSDSSPRRATEVDPRAPFLVGDGDAFVGGRQVLPVAAAATFTSDGRPPRAAALAEGALVYVEAGTTRLLRRARASHALGTATELGSAAPVCDRCLAVDAGRVYVGEVDGIHALDASTGASLGVVPTGKLTLVAIAAAGGLLAFGGSGVGSGVYTASSDGDDLVRVTEVVPSDVQLHGGFVFFAATGHGVVLASLDGTTQETVVIEDVARFAASDAALAWLVGPGPAYRLYSRRLGS